MPLGKLRVVCIRNILKTKSKPAKKNTGCKNSANLEQETKTTKVVTYPLLSLASSYGTWAMLVLNLPAFENKKYES